MITARASVSALSLATIILCSGAANAVTRPCTWLTPEEVSTAAGAKMTAAEDKKNPVTGMLRGCYFRTASVVRGINIDTYERPNTAAAQQFFDQLLKDAARLPGEYGKTHSAPITPVPGIGDQAAGVGNQLYVRKGTNLFVIGITDSLEQAPTESGFQKAKKLAPVILSRM